VEAALRIVIDAESCQGHGRCWDSAPELVDDDDAGHGVVRGDGTVPAELEEKARTVFHACPEQAVTLSD
jgi:ferredoxin